VVAKVRERLAVSKQTTQTFGMDRFNLKKLDEAEVKKHNRVEVSNMFCNRTILSSTVLECYMR
jgi:hypothetical protein